MIAALTRRIGALVLLGIAAAGLHLAGSTVDTLAPSQAWAAAGNDPLLVATNLMRLAAAVVCGWLMLITVADSLAILLDLRLLRRLTTALAPAAWRSLVLRPVAAATLILPPVVMPVASAVPAVAMASPDADAYSETDEEPLTVDHHGLKMVVLSEDGFAPTLTMSVAADPPATEPQPSSEPYPSEARHIVEGGENLWLIATEHLTTQLGRQPTSRETTSYWQEVIATNHAALPDPANPDLIFPGIELRMPPVHNTMG